MREEIGIKAAKVAKVLYKFLKHAQGFRWKTDYLLFTYAISGIILAQLSLGTCKPSIKLIMMWSAINISLCQCMFLYMCIPCVSVEGQGSAWQHHPK